MTVLAAILVATLLLCVGAFALGRRSNLSAILLSAPLLGAAWKLIGVKLSYGEGAASGVAVFFGVVWYAGVSCGLLAISMLAGSYRARRSAIMLTLMVGVAATLVVRVANRVMPGTPDVAASPAVSPPATPPRSTYTEGYAWAVDNGVDSLVGCVDGAQAFIDGCKAAVRSH